MAEVEVFLNVQNELGEGPLWNVEEQALYWVDISKERFHRWTQAAGQVETFPVGQPVGVVMLRAAGGYVMGLRDGIGFWENGAIRLVATPEAGKPKARFNDGTVDRRGRFWAGTYVPEGLTSALYRLDPDGSCHQMETGVGVSNGIGWSPDDKVMYYTDSRPHVIYAYDFDAATGSIANRRVWVRTGDNEVPDGLAVDREGFIWSAKWDGWKVTRYDPDGKIEREIPIPAQRVTSCAFGGPNLDELYITSARDRLTPEQLAKQPAAGDIFRLRPGVRGFPPNKFAG